MLPHTRVLTTARSQVATLAPVPRFAVIAATAGLVLGGLLGLVLGLIANPPTAWFAVVEVGIPAAVLGAVGGAAVGLVTEVVQRVGRR